MRTVFINDMVAHVWAQQNQDYGRSNNGNFYFKGAVIYSYRDTWPLAMFLSDEVPRFKKLVGANIVINNESYGITTSQHLGDVYNALRGLGHSEVRIGSHKLMQRLVDCHQSGWRENKDVAMIQELCAWNQEQYEYYKRRYKELGNRYKSYRQAPAKYADVLRNAVRHMAMYNAALKALRGDERFIRGKHEHSKKAVSVQARDLNAWTALHDEVHEYIHERDRNKQAKQQERERAAQEAREQRKAALKEFKDEAFKAWRLFEDREASDNIREAVSHYILDYMTETRLRAKPPIDAVGGTVFTSRGASVPLEDAKRFMRGVNLLIADARRRGLAYIVPTQSQNVGHFSLRHVSLHDRCVQVGCHKLTFDEINAFIDFAKQHQPELEITDEYKIQEIEYAAH